MRRGWQSDIGGRRWRGLVAAGLCLTLSSGAQAGPGATGGPTPLQATADEARELESLQNEIGRFEEASKDYRGTITHIVQSEYAEKRRELMGKYQGQLDLEEKEEKSRRVSAIALFEDFLARYANDARWTPDVMFRLAELYFEKSNDEYLSATAAGGSATPDYQKTIDVYKQLIARFPNYRLVDGAYYLLGWCLGEMNQEGESLQAFRSLVCSNKYNALDPPAPPQPSKGRGGFIEVDPYKDCVPVKTESRFLPEAWTRVGEFHFDNSELELAIAAYQRVLQFKDSAYFDKALYKLAWSFYRADNYPESVKRFDELVVYSDKKKAETGGEGSDLRTEAVQYLGISFAEKDWNGDGMDDPETGLERAKKFYQGRESEPHVREIFAKLGDIYFDETEFQKAIDVYKDALQRWPFHPDNPKLQDRVVLCYERMRDFQKANQERDVMVATYTKGTEWYKKNRDNKEALDSASELAESALVTAAVNHHKTAQELKKLAGGRPTPEQAEKILKEYTLASIAYEKYLEAYPHSKNTYEYQYSYADTLYYSAHYIEAAKQYEKVRDSQLDNKYAEDASFNAIKAYEKFLELQEKAGKFAMPPIPADGKVTVPVQPMEIPETVLAMQKAYDSFVEHVPTSGRVGTITYKAAEIPLRYLHWDEARKRMEEVVTKYCKNADNIGANAGQAILATYIIEKNLDKIEEWGLRLKQAACGSGEVAAKNADEATKLVRSTRFKKADKLFEDKKYEEAAVMYINLVDENPKGDDSDNALNNAAVCYGRVNRFAAATKLYERIVTDYPNSKYVDDALFQTAESYKKAFEFDSAVASYLRLAEDKRFANSTHRTDSIYNAAVLEESNQNYGKAVDLFRRYSADKSVKREDQSESFFRVAKLYEKMKQPDQTIKAMNEYIHVYGSDEKGKGRVLEAYFDIARAQETQKNHKGALDTYHKIVALGASAPPASDAAEYAAHAAYILTEERLPIVEKSQIKGSGKQLSASVLSFKKNVEELIAEYNKVLAYRRVSWTLAAYFRTGYVYEMFSKALLAAPCPPDVKKKFGDEGCDVYRQQIEQMVSGVDEEAVKRYTVTLQKAGELGVSNEWTKRARDRANAYKPDVFPLVKDERVGMEQP